MKKTWDNNELLMGNPPTLVAVLDKGRSGWTVYIPMQGSHDGYDRDEYTHLPKAKARKAAEKLVDEWFSRFNV